MKKKLYLLALCILVMSGCTSNKVNPYPTSYLIENINNVQVIDEYLDTGIYVDKPLKNSNTLLMLSAKYSTDIDVVKTILAYGADATKKNSKTGLTALDMISLRHGVDDIYKVIYDAYQNTQDKKIKTYVKGSITIKKTIHL
jgi:ankyrin repeat protein